MSVSLKYLSSVLLPIMCLISRNCSCNPARLDAGRVVCCVCCAIILTSVGIVVYCSLPPVRRPLLSPLSSPTTVFKGTTVCQYNHSCPPTHPYNRSLSRNKIPRHNKTHHHLLRTNKQRHNTTTREPLLSSFTAPITSFILQF